MAAFAPAQPPPANLVEHYQTAAALWTESDALLNRAQLVHADTGLNLTPTTLKNHIGRQNGGAAIMMAVTTANEAHPKVVEMVMYPAQSLSVPHEPGYHGELWGLHGPVIDNQLPLVRIPDDIFHQTAMMRHWTPAHLINVCQSNPALVWVDPPAAGEAESESHRTRHGVVVPPRYAGLIRATNASPSEYFRVVLPQAIADGEEANMTALTYWMACRLQRKENPAYANDATLPQYLDESELQRAGVSLSPSDHQIVTLIRESVAKYKSICPGSHGTTRADADLNSVVKSYIDSKAADRVAQEEARAKKEQESKSVKSKIGTAAFARLSITQGTVDEGQMGAFWGVEAATSEKEKLNAHQANLEEIARQFGYHDLDFGVSPTDTTTIKAMKPYTPLGECTRGGGLSNVFSSMFAEPNVDLQTEVAVAVSFLEGGGNGMTFEDAKQLSKLKACLPTNEGVFDHLRRWNVWSHYVESATSPWREWVRRTVEHVLKFEGRVRKYIMPDAGDRHLKGVHIIYYVSAIASTYHRSLLQDNEVEDLPKPEAIVGSMTMGRRWQLCFTPGFIVSMKVDAFTRLQASLMTPAANPPQPAWGVPAPQPQPAPPPPAPQVPPVPHPQPPQQASRCITNPTYNGALFDEFRARPFRAKDIRARVSAGRLPAFPISRVDGGAMCIGFHVKGMCNERCPRAADHVAYNATQYAPMKQWCTEHYPREGQE